ncbi:MAG: adenine deaminase [Acidimicrobiia bacterium]|nr:adenine deaminase [Acidimicrobiia bacterium]MYG71621.1 adenine deaminase [Acidimicrobiia bacterium]
MQSYLDEETRSRAVAAALGNESFDLILSGGTVVDVGTGELRQSDVGLVGPMVASVHPTGSRTDTADTFDCSDRFIAPGFIDMHVHFESSMLTPGGYAEVVCPRGTTTVFIDPHELANIAGVEGVRYAVDASRGLPVRFVVQAPSCVPPLPGLELSGHDLHAADIAEMLSWDEVGGLAEVMDMGGVLTRDARMVDIVAAGHDSGKLVSGHAAGLTGPALQAYLSAGIFSDHEVFAHVDAMEKLRAGMTVELRGAFDFVLPLLIEELAQLPEFPTHLIAATDDLFALTLLEEGGIDDLLRRLIRYGLSPVRAIRIATYNAAYRLQRTDLGQVAAGRRADIVVLSSLEEVTVDDVFFDGRRVAHGGAMLEPVVEAPSNPPLDTIQLPDMTPEHFVFRLPGVADGKRRIRVVEGVVLTDWGETEVEVTDGIVAIPDGYLLNVVVHRHGRIAANPVAGLLGGWGDWIGAVATTISHDTHNLSVFGRDPSDMAVAANAVIATGGGVAVARDGEVAAILELPVAGILSPLPAAEVARIQGEVGAAAEAIGLPPGPLTQPLFSVMLMSLACLTGPHVTDIGVVDGTLSELVDDLILS